MTTSCFWSPRSRNTANAAGPSTPPKIKVLELNGWRRGKILIEKDILFWIFRWDHHQCCPGSGCFAAAGFMPSSSPLVVQYRNYLPLMIVYALYCTVRGISKESEWMGDFLLLYIV